MRLNQRFIFFLNVLSALFVPLHFANTDYSYIISEGVLLYSACVLCVTTIYTLQTRCIHLLCVAVFIFFVNCLFQPA